MPESAGPCGELDPLASAAAGCINWWHLLLLLLLTVQLQVQCTPWSCCSSWQLLSAPTHGCW